ncbi:hypothetical protein [Streptomyces sp. Je 1-369]|uniref:hypothetical protein n=1 Tax=Streptomyces sp. Je 1-369 TaxID=2966192 RepID=UPI002285BA52|nr:hypothetical protein [Streptomyces sp. Je 1-369]WAM00575.1 hypothetical protein NOO62_35175 [Streptomyces sp. Je 1-369]
MLIAGWFFLTRVEHVGLRFDPGYEIPVAREFAPVAAVTMLFMPVFGLGGGWILADRFEDRTACSCAAPRS